MELYILSKDDLSIESIVNVSDYEINLDEETNAKSIFKIFKCNGLKEGNYLVLNGLYKQFLFIIAKDGISIEKGSSLVTVTALDISNIFDRKVIEKNIDTMTTNSIEEFIANTISENFVNSTDIYTNKSYIDIYWHTNTQSNVATNSENGLYNFHTFLINCRQSKNIYADFSVTEDNRLRIDIENKEDTTVLVDTTLDEISEYNKVYETEVTARVQVYIREDGSEYNLYLKTDRTTTTNKDDTDRATGNIEVISVETADKANEEALNVMKGNTYNHLVEFKIRKSSKLINVNDLYIGRNILIKTEDDTYESYISAKTIKDEEFIYFKTGNLRITLLDKLKKKNEVIGNKLDLTGGTVKGTLNIVGGPLQVDNSKVVGNDIITARLPRNNSFQSNGGWLWEDLGSLVLKEQIGTKLNIKDGKIVVGKNVSKISVSLSCPAMWGSVANGDKGIGFAINGVVPFGSYISGEYYQYFPSSIAPTCQNVSEGDIISLRAFSANSGQFGILESFITVEVIE